MKYGRYSEWNKRFKRWNERSSSILTTYIQTCNKLQSNARDTAYQYEYHGVRSIYGNITVLISVDTRIDEVFWSVE